MSTTVDKGEVRPAPAIGQQWQHEHCAAIWTITHIDDHGDYPVEFVDQDGNAGAWELDMRHCRFLGYAPGSRPSTEGRPRPQAGQRWRDTGKWIMSDGRPNSSPVFYAGEAFTLTKPARSGLGWHDDRSVSEWAVAHFTNGRLEFVDHGSPAPTPVALEETRPAPVVAAKPIRRVPESCLLERWNETGPLSAIEAIQAKKPPEPWRPSADEYDLLPDAGTSWSDTRGSGRP